MIVQLGRNFIIAVAIHLGEPALLVHFFVIRTELFNDLFDGDVLDVFSGWNVQQLPDMAAEVHVVSRIIVPLRPQILHMLWIIRSRHENFYLGGLSGLLDDLAELLLQVRGVARIGQRAQLVGHLLEGRAARGARM